VPARVARPLTDEERQIIRDISARYVALKERYVTAIGRGY
jgi:carbonic anhydrase/acetyltransferase-like protein (isoleucine patch superfamily)